MFGADFREITVPVGRALSLYSGGPEFEPSSRPLQNDFVWWSEIQLLHPWKIANWFDGFLQVSVQFTRFVGIFQCPQLTQ